jgi:hypothetical protein
MNPSLESFLGELYAIDPGLRAHEQELLPLLEKMLRTKPDAVPDPAFVEHLRLTLGGKIDQKNYSSSSFFSFLTMRNVQYTLTGLVLGALVAAPLTYSLTQSGGIPSFGPSDSTQQLFSYSVEEKGSEAFGDLSTVSPAYGRGGGGGGAEAMSAQPAVPAADSALPVEPVNRDQSGGGGGEVPIGMPYPTDKMMIAPELTEYHLTFNGELPALSDTVDVFKRQKGTASSDLSKILGSFNTGLIDLGSFSNAKTDMISFYQDSSYGYMVNVSFREGAVNINQNWEKWPHPESNCRDEACFQSYRLKAEDVPADDVVIAVAEAFVRDHDVDLSQYGEPEVNNQWRVQYAAATDKSMVWIPDGVQVIYPLLVDGKPVYDEGGTKAGIGINVNVREKKVSDVWGMMDQKYQKSAYAGVSDPAAITAFLENYGKIQGSWMPPDTVKKTVDITLGTPEVSLVRMYNYQNNQSEELLVPALVFPVTNVPAGEYFYNTSITVPLALDLFKQRTGDGQPIPLPRPLMMEDSAAPASGQ